MEKENKEMKTEEQIEETVDGDSAQEEQAAETAADDLTETEEEKVADDSTEEKKEERELRSYEKIKPTWWEQLSLKTKVLIISITSVVIILAIVITVFAVRAHLYNLQTRGVEVYMKNGDVTGVRMFKDAVYTDDSEAFVFADENASVTENFHALSTDGKYVYFTEDASGGAFSLYCCKLNGKGTTLIAENVTDYDVYKKGVVYYAAERNLYSYEVKSKKVKRIKDDTAIFHFSQKKDKILTVGSGVLATADPLVPGSEVVIADKVTGILGVDDDLESIVYCGPDGRSVYGKYKEEEPVLITEQAQEISVHMTEDKYEVYFLDNGTGLYYYQRGDKEPVLIQEDVKMLYGGEQSAGVLMSYSGDDGYYFVKTGKAVKMDTDKFNGIYYEVYCNASEGELLFQAYDEKSDKELYRVSSKLFSKIEMECLDTDVETLEFVDGVDFCVSKVTQDNTFELYYNGVRVAEDFVPGTLQRTGDKKAIIFACETEEDERILMIYDGVELKEIGAYVGNSIIPVSRKLVYYMDELNGANHFMKYNGKESKSIAENVSEIGYIFY